MNPELPRPPREEMELRLTALLLGELSAEEGAAVRRAIEQDGELAKLFARLHHTIPLIREAAASPDKPASAPTPPLKLSEERRQKLLAQFKTVTPKEFAPERQRDRFTLVELAAVLVILGSLVAISLPMMSPSRGLVESQVDVLGARLASNPAREPLREDIMLLQSPAPAGGSTIAYSLDAVGYVDSDATKQQPATETNAVIGESSARAEAPAAVFYSQNQAAAPANPLPAQLGRERIVSANESTASSLPSIPSPSVVAPSPKIELPPAEPFLIAVANDGEEVALADNALLGISRGLNVSAVDSATGLPVATPEFGVAQNGSQKSEKRFGNYDSGGELSLTPVPPSSRFAVAESAPQVAVAEVVDNLALGEESKSIAGRAYRSRYGITPAEPAIPRVAVSGSMRDGGGGADGLGAITATNSTGAANQGAAGYYAMRGGNLEFAEGKSSWVDYDNDGRLDMFTAQSAATPSSGGVVPVLGDLPTVGQLFQNPGLGSSAAGSSAMPGRRIVPEPDVTSVNVVDYANEPAKPLGFTPGKPAVKQSSSIVLPYVQLKTGQAGIESGVSPQPMWDVGTAVADEATKSTTLVPERLLEATSLATIPQTAREQEGERQTVKRDLDRLSGELAVADMDAGDPTPASLADYTAGKPAEDGRQKNSQRGEVTQLYFAKQRELEELSKPKKEALGKPTDVAIRKPATNAPVPQPEVQTSENNFSTFSLNVSDVSFKLAAASLEKGQRPDAATVRSEEFINAFDYRDPEPAPGAPIAFAWERARYPFAHNRELLRFSLKTAAAGRQAGRPLNVVLLLDNSGSMERADRVQIIREALRVLASQLQPQDKLSVITFARTARLVADGIAGDKAGEIGEQVGGLTPQGGTNLEDALNLAYQTAARHYLAHGINRVVLLTDGAANLGDVEPDSLKQKVEAQRQQGIALDCFGIGWEGFNDDLLEVLSRNGDGRYGFINSPAAAATDFAGQLAGALKVAASDVKVQVEFNPKRVTSYRQIGYAKHQLTKEQFRDNTVDAAEIAAQEAGNALYTVEVNPAGEGPLATVRVRYKVPGTSDYREQAWDVPFTGNAPSLEQSSPAMRLAASASAFSEWLVASPFSGEVSPDALLGYLRGVPEIYGADIRPKKLEWMIHQAKSIEGK